MATNLKQWTVDRRSGGILAEPVKSKVTDFFFLDERNDDNWATEIVVELEQSLKNEMENYRILTETFQLERRLRGRMRVRCAPLGARTDNRRET